MPRHWMACLSWSPSSLPGGGDRREKALLSNIWVVASLNKLPELEIVASVDDATTSRCPGS